MKKKSKPVLAWGIKTNLRIYTDTSWKRAEAMENRNWPWDKVVRVEIREVVRKKRRKFDLHKDTRRVM